MKAANTNNNRSPKPACLTMLLLAIGMSSAAAQEAVDTGKLFKEGVFLREQGKLFSSIEALETVLSNNPSLQRARLELAVAYFRALNYAQAAEQAQKVLDDPKTPDNVRLAVMAFLAQIKLEQVALLAKRHTWEPSVSLGLLYDTNVNVGPSGATLPGGLVLAPGASPVEDWAGVLQAGITHTYNSPTVMRFGETATRFIWQSRANLYQKSYFDQDNFDLRVLSLSTGPGWLAPNNWRANVNVQFDDLTLGSEHLALYSSIAPSITWQLKNAELTWDAIWLNKDFKRSVDDGRNSDYVATGVSYGHLFNRGEIAVQGGLHAFDENADASRFSNHGWEAFIGANFVAWQNGSVYGRLGYKESQFDGVEPVYAIARNEHENRYEIGFGHDFKEGTLAGWRLSGSWQRTQNHSNVSIYTYDRDVTSIQLARSF
jgi:tetratricopeptide (TPR) repeat protein